MSDNPFHEKYPLVDFNALKMLWTIERELNCGCQQNFNEEEEMIYRRFYVSQVRRGADWKPQYRDTNWIAYRCTMEDWKKLDDVEWPDLQDWRDTQTLPDPRSDSMNLYPLEEEE